MDGQLKYEPEDYLKAIDFCLNFPDEIDHVEYKTDKDIFNVIALCSGFGGWTELNLIGSFVRHALAWKGKRQWNYGSDNNI